jgi:hypothetical protein
MAGSALSARTAAPAGSDAPPASATTPLGPTSTPGVASPWTASSAVIVEKAQPRSTLRPSRLRTPTSVRAAEAAAAVNPPVSASQKCATPVSPAGVVANPSTTAPGSVAEAASRARSSGL